MLDLMTWQEIVDKLQTDGDFKMAAMFDNQGEMIAATENSTMGLGEALGIMKTMNLNSKYICGIFVSGAKFSCLAIDKNNLVGRAYTEVFAAHRINNMLVCVVGDSREGASVLGYIKNFMMTLNTPPAVEEEDKTHTVV